MMESNFDNFVPHRGDSLSQMGDGNIAIYENNGLINIFLENPNPTPEEIANTFHSFSPLRHSYPTLRPVIKRTRQLEEILNWIEQPANPQKPARVGFVTGSPGVGKTAFLNILYDNLTEKNKYLVWGLKVDQIEFRDVEDIAGKMKFKYPLVQAIEKIRSKYERVVILIDQIDALSLSLSSDRTPLNSISNFIQNLNRIEGVRVLVSCRDYDINYDDTLKRISDSRQHWRLGNFSREEVTNILAANGREVHLSDSMLEFLGNPLNLSLYLKVDETAVTLNPLNINSLYDIIWKQDILNTKSKTRKELRLIPLIDNLSELMHSEQRISIPSIRYQSEFNDEIQYLTTCGFIREENNLLQFSHQTLFDYVYARRFVEQGKSITEELCKTHQGLFIRSEIHSVLLFLRSHDPETYIATIQSILNDPSVRFHIKVLSLTLLAYQESPLVSEISLFRRIIWPDKEFGRVFLKAIHEKKWFDIVMSTIKIYGGWKRADRQYRSIIIDSTLRTVYIDNSWNLLLLEEILNCAEKDEQNSLLAKIQSSRIQANPDLLKDFHTFLKKINPDLFYPEILPALAQHYPELVAEEVKAKVSYALGKTERTSFYRFSIGYEWDKVFKVLDNEHPDISLDLSFDLMHMICHTSGFENPTQELKPDFAYLNINRISDFEQRYEITEYVYNHIIDTLVDKRKRGEDVSCWLQTLLKSEYGTFVRAGINVLLETSELSLEGSYAVLTDKHYLERTPSWVQYYVIELLRVEFPLFSVEQQKTVVDTIMSIESNHDKLNVNLEGGKRMELGIPMTYQGWELGKYLAVIPEDLLKKNSSNAWHEYQRVSRKFKHLENDRPYKMEVLSGWTSIKSEAASRMGIDEWKSSMKKYNTDVLVDFKTPSLTGQCEIFKQEVASNPDKFMPLLLEIFDEDEISMQYLISGLEGLVKAGRIDKAAIVTEKLFNEWLDDVNTERRGFSAHRYLFAINDVLKQDKIEPIFINSIIRIVLEKDDSHDMEYFSGSDITTHSINTTRGNAAEKLVTCVKYPEYDGKIFETLESIASTANVSTRAAALLNLALLNRIDKDRNVDLFKILLHDFDSLLMSMPVHRYNPLVYFVRYAFDRLAEYFEKVVDTPESHATQISILWLAHLNGNAKAMDYIERILSVNPIAASSLVSFLRIQKCYDDDTVRFVIKLIREIPYSEDIATNFDSYIEYVPFNSNQLEETLIAYSESELIMKHHHGYLDILKRLSVVKPELTLECLSISVDRMTKDGVFEQNLIAEIIINSYNKIRKHRDPDIIRNLEKGMDIMDSILREASVPSNLNNYINQIDNT